MAAIAHETAPIRASGLRRHGWLLIAAFGAAILIIMIQVVLYPELDAQLRARAVELGHRPPLEEYARIQAQYAPRSTLDTALTLLIGPLPFGLLAAAVFRIRQSLPDASTQRFSGTAWYCALGALMAWLVVLYLDWGVKAGPDQWPPLVSRFDQLYDLFGFAASWLGQVAIICAALAVYKAGIAPRVALAALIVAALLLLLDLALAIASGFAAGLPPLLPLLPSLILGIGLARVRPA